MGRHGGRLSPGKPPAWQSPCPLTSEIPLRLVRDLRGHCARLLPTFNRAPDIAFEDGSRPLWRMLKNRERMRSVIPELLPRAEMGRTEGTDMPAKHTSFPTGPQGYGIASERNLRLVCELVFDPDYPRELWGTAGSGRSGGR